MKTTQLKGFPNYTIYEDGTVYNHILGKVVKSFPMKQTGYWMIGIYDDSHKQRHQYLHRLLAICFLENPNNLPEVHHVDGDKSNNNISNLEWISRIDNRRKRIYGRGEVPVKQQLRMKKYYLKTKLNELFDSGIFTAESIQKMIAIRTEIGQLTQTMKLMVNPKYKKQD